MVAVALTGGVGSGKSSVARLLAAHGAWVVDADALAREVVQPGTPGLASVIEAFGSTILTPAGSLDRPALAQLVFADPAALKRLEAIIHPLVGARAAELMAAAPADAVAVYDVPLFVERGGQFQFDLVVVVDAGAATQRARLIARRGWSEAEAASRIAAQDDRDARLAVADVVLVNEGTPLQLAEQVDALWQRLKTLTSQSDRGIGQE